MDYKNNQLNIHLKTNFNDNKMSKNIFYDLDNIKNESRLNFILKDLKIQITDIWKSVNIINLATPLSIRIKFQHRNLHDLNELKNAFHKISIIDDYSLDEFNISNSFFKIYYYGNPRKLRSELLKFGYQLKSDQGYWRLYLNE